MKNTRYFATAFVAFSLLSLTLFAACKQNKTDEQAPAPTASTNETETVDVTASTNETETVDVNAPPNGKTYHDYGDDELGIALNTYQKEGYWFKEGLEVPKLIENLGSRIDYWEPVQDESGKTYQFAEFSRPLNFDGEIVKYKPTLCIYEGETNLKDAILCFQAMRENFTRDKSIEENARTFFPRDEPKTLDCGLIVKDSYPISDMPVNTERYEGKHVLLFGVDRYTDVWYIFDIK